MQFKIMEFFSQAWAWIQENYKTLLWVNVGWQVLSVLAVIPILLVVFFLVRASRSGGLNLSLKEKPGESDAADGANEENSEDDAEVR